MKRNLSIISKEGVSRVQVLFIDVSAYICLLNDPNSGQRSKKIWNIYYTLVRFVKMIKNNKTEMILLSLLSSTISNKIYKHFIENKKINISKFVFKKFQGIHIRTYNNVSIILFTD